MEQDDDDHDHETSPVLSVCSHVDFFALLLHYMMLNEGFRSATPPEFHPRIPDDWRSRSAHGMYAFTYRHERSSMQFQVKMMMLGKNRLVINAIAAEQEDRMITVEFNVSDYVDENQWRQYQEQEKEEHGEEEEGKEKKKGKVPLEDVVKKLEQLEPEVRTKLVRKLVPESKEGYEQETSSRQTQSDERMRRELEDRRMADEQRRSRLRYEDQEEEEEIGRAHV